MYPAQSSEGADWRQTFLAGNFWYCLVQMDLKLWSILFSFHWDVISDCSLSRAYATIIKWVCFNESRPLGEILLDLQYAHLLMLNIWLYLEICIRCSQVVRKRTKKHSFCPDFVFLPASALSCLLRVWHLLPRRSCAADLLVPGCWWGAHSKMFARLDVGGPWCLCSLIYKTSSRRLGLGMACVLCECN